MPKKVLTGTVTSNKNEKTVVIAVKSRKTHRLYKKTYTTSKKYHVHNPGDQLNIGDIISIVECRPYSKTKKWHVIQSDGGISS